MAKIYSSYDEEPDPVFEPLTDQEYCTFYDLEMGSYTEDGRYYDSILRRDGNFLDLGCGTGRLTTILNSQGRTIIGADNSLQMLKKATSVCPENLFVCMDMTMMTFQGFFDAIIIGYNTLNMLTTEKKVVQCLSGCRDALKMDGTIHLQLYTPTPDFCLSNNKSFQFQLLRQPCGGLVIKEILKQFTADHTVTIEERYRVRPTPNKGKNRELKRIYRVTGFSGKRWQTLFSRCGFTVVNSFGDFNGTIYDPRNCGNFIAQLKRS
ncbi:class I SAM-dependent methyltransferase [Desulforhopalus singaporensis]|uniref:Methyltransferase domain-containing protein n=1 Tax=Desulforhopalus singaporensis TaxID=91360 RepID=A0A1H0MQ70_9BACT|nr:class I SAM-dependent methyltransferase [Desulforhopalus singaporensis]SDO82494.1 Methyltransferase domain-containing protein [Desulforhopalus singaporensis]